MIKSDKWIKEQRENLIVPFYPGKVSNGVISYGTSHAGYDLTLSKNGAHQLYTNDKDFRYVNPKDFKPEFHVKDLRYSNEFDAFVLSANSSALCVVNERLVMPPDVMGLVWGKSTYSRCGVNVYCQPVEPGWEGYLSILVVNYNNTPALLYPDEGIAQVVFFELDNPSEVPYSGKYQNQQNKPTFGKV